MLPQATRIVIPAIGNEFIAMIKDSALVSTITVHETLFLAQRIGRSAFEPVAALIIAGAVYVSKRRPVAIGADSPGETVAAATS